MEEISLTRLERKSVDGIGNEDVRHIEHGNGAEQVEPAGAEPVLEAGKIDRVIDRLAPGVVRLELQAVAVPFGERCSQPVINRAAVGSVCRMLELARRGRVERAAGGVSAGRRRAQGRPNRYFS